MPRAKGGSIPPPRVMIGPNHGGSIAELNDNDVLSGRGGRINNHPGNITFRTVVEDYKREYLDPRTRKLEKAHVAARLVAQIRSTNPPGRFLREEPGNPGRFVEIGDQKAWKKAGQALREDAPDVRKEIDEEMEDVKVKGPAVQLKYGAPPPQSQQPPPPPPNSGYPHQHRPGVPSGIPPSVSYSPTSASHQMQPLAPPAVGGGRSSRGMDPPEAPGVSGYRQPPLRYLGRGRGAASGRGVQPGQPYSGRGRGPPPQQGPQQQYQQYPPQPGYHPGPNYYGPPPNQQHFPHGQPPPPNQYQQHRGGPPQPQYQQQQMPYHHQPGYHPQHGHHPGHQTNGTGPLPQFTAPQDKRGKKLSGPPVFAGGPVNKHVGGKPPSRDGELGQGHFPLTTSIATDFTMSDISNFGDSTRTNPAMMESLLGSPPRGREHQQSPGEVGQCTQQIGQGVQKQSSTSKSSGGSSNKSKESFTMSDLMASNQSLNFSFGHSGRTRSFPDLMLSTGDLLPPLPAEKGESDRDINGDGKEGDDQPQRSSSGRILRHAFHRQSSSESSNHSMTSLTIKGFHPVRGRANTNMSGINDTMSIMSLDSRKSVKSESSSWLDNFRSMQSINSDMNPWEANGSTNTRNHPYGGDDAGSVRSFLSDVSDGLNALDLAADPLLPPIYQDGLNDSDLGEFMMRPDP